jgi:hypothetical protein
MTSDLPLPVLDAARFAMDDRSSLVCRAPDAGNRVPEIECRESWSQSGSIRIAEKSGDYISRFRRQPVLRQPIQLAEVVPPAAAAQPVVSPFCARYAGRWSAALLRLSALRATPLTPGESAYVLIGIEFTSRRLTICQLPEQADECSRQPSKSQYARSAGPVNGPFASSEGRVICPVGPCDTCGRTRRSSWWS